MMHNRTTKEHFISRAAFLRNFSNSHYSDDSQNCLAAYDKVNNKAFISNVYNLGCEKDLYECALYDENAIEDFLRDYEKDYTPEIRHIVTLCDDPRNNSALVLNSQTEKENLKLFMTFHFFRTPKKRDELMADGSGKEAFLYGLIGRTENGEWLIKHNVDQLSHHYFVFERNETEIPYVLPDHPVQLFRSRDEENGINFRFPVSSSINILLVDPLSDANEHVKNFRNRIRVIPAGNESEIVKWNQRALDYARRFIYFNPDYRLEQLV